MPVHHNQGSLTNIEDINMSDNGIDEMILKFSKNF